MVALPVSSRGCVCGSGRESVCVCVMRPRSQTRTRKGTETERERRREGNDASPIEAHSVLIKEEEREKEAYESTDRQTT